MRAGKSFHKFMLLWSGELISAIGSGLTAFGLEIYVFQQTGKASATALVALLAFMPGIFMAVFAGVLADRYDRRLMMILGDSLSAVGVLFILICMFKGEAQLWQICMGVTISSLFSSLMDPSYKATITDLLTEEEYAKASGLVQIAGSARFLISPALAGLLLAFSTKAIAGMLESAVAMGMLVSSILLGFLPVRQGYVKMLSVSMFLDGIFMAEFGFREDLLLITISGFLFFAMIPFANACLDYLLRTNIDDALQGRAWAMIGVVSQLGQILAFSIAGVLADYVFTPLFLKGGFLAGSVGRIIGTGSGRGRGFLIMVAGMLLCITSLVLYNMKSIRKLEKKNEICLLQSNLE